MLDLDKIGGVPIVLNKLLTKGILHGDVLTVTGKTMRNNLESMTFPVAVDQDIVKSIEDPIHNEGVSESCMVR